MGPGSKPACSLGFATSLDLVELIGTKRFLRDPETEEPPTILVDDDASMRFLGSANSGGSVGSELFEGELSRRPPRDAPSIHDPAFYADAGIAEAWASFCHRSSLSI